MNHNVQLLINQPTAPARRIKAQRAAPGDRRVYWWILPRNIFTSIATVHMAKCFPAKHCASRSFKRWL